MTPPSVDLAVLVKEVWSSLSVPLAMPTSMKEVWSTLSVPETTPSSVRPTVWGKEV